MKPLTGPMIAVLTFYAKRGIENKLPSPYISMHVDGIATGATNDALVRRGLIQSGSSRTSMGMVVTAEGEALVRSWGVDLPDILYPCGCYRWHRDKILHDGRGCRAPY